MWEGNRGDGTSGYERYGRRYRVIIAGKADLLGSADVAFRGDQDQHNPEDLFLTAIAACHMLTYLALCARHGVSVVAYEDTPHGTMREDRRGGGRFEDVLLRPSVTVASASQVARAEQLHAAAHDCCYIASSCRVPIRHEATVKTEREVSG